MGAGHGAGDGGVLALAGDLIHLVDVDDAGLGTLHVEIRGLDQAQEDVLDVLTHVAGLGQRGRVGNREGDVQDLGQGLREEGLAGAGRSDQKDVALLHLHVGVLAEVDPLVVVVDRDGEGDLRLLLADDIVVHVFLDLPGSRELLGIMVSRRAALIHILLDEARAELDAFVADIDVIGTGHHSFDLLLPLAAEGTANGFFTCQGGPSFLSGLSAGR